MGTQFSTTGSWLLSVEVFGLGYDAWLVLLFDVGIVLVLVFVAGLLRLFFPQLYKN
jgi:hypothetical protein